MMVEFLRPLFLLLIPIGIIILILLKKKYNIWRKCVIITLMILSSAGMQIRIPDIFSHTSTVFAVDASSSVKSKLNENIDFINDAVQKKKASDKTALVFFGKNSELESELSDEKRKYGFSSLIDETQTNIEDALSLAVSAMDDDGKKRIVLFSDGTQTMKDALKQAYSLADDGVRIDTLELSENFDEVQLSQIDVRKNIAFNSLYKIKITVDSNTDTSAKLNIYRNDVLFKSEDIAVESGRSYFEYDDKADIQGTISIRAEIIPQKDTFKENNIVYSMSFCGDSAQLLVVDSQADDTLEKIFPDLDIVSVYPQQTPDYINNYDAVVINNCSFDSLNKKFVEQLESYVKNSGGLIVTGGENSFAPGGYKDTVFDDILPVTSEVKDDKRSDKMGILVLLDRSGSMNVLSKLDMAKEAVIRSAYMLNDDDYFGVIAFDDGAEEIVPYGKLNKALVEEKVSTVTSGGGTDITDALKQAFRIMKKSDTQIKHIILITDGQDSKTGSKSVASNIKNAGITLSTVAVGNDADTELLGKVAENGGGRYYFTSEFTDLPQILISETDIAGKNYVSNEPFIPVTAENEQLAPLGGYIRTQIKSRAKLETATPDGYPVMATLQYGLGRSAVFTSDIKKQTADFFADEKSVAKFKDIFSYVMRNRDNAQYDISVNTTGEKTEIVFKGESEPKSAKVYIGDNNKTCDFSMTNQNEYTAYIDAVDSGSYGMNISMADGSLITTGFAVAYSDEFNILDRNGGSVMEKLSEITGGKVITDPNEVFYDIAEASYFRFSLETILAVMSALLFVIDLLKEKVSIKPIKKRERKQKRTERTKAERKSSIDTLLSNKNRR